MSEFYVGDIVTDVILGKTGKVLPLNCAIDSKYPIRIEFDEYQCTYTLDGKQNISDAIPRLYHGEVTIEIKQPVYEYQAVYKFKKDDYLSMTSKHRYISKEEFLKENPATNDGEIEFIELYQPSKRVRK